ncbi:ABC transporter permease [Flavobacteriaceae bacterium GF1]
MIRSYLKIAWRNLLKNRTYSIINIGGLAIGLTIAILIGLWIHDETAFNKSFGNYDAIGQILINKTFDGETRTRYTLPYPLASELRNVYGDDFKYVVMGSFPGDNILSFEEKNLAMFGVFMEEDALRMFSLNMLKGDKSALGDPNSIVLSESTAKELFGNQNPMGAAIKVNNDQYATVRGVFEDLPKNSNIFDALSFESGFKKLNFIAPWDHYVATNEWVKTARDRNLWDNNSYQVYVQIRNGSTMKAVNEKIKNAVYNHVPDGTKQSNPEIFVHPMKDWHLKSSFKNGLSIGGAIAYVRMFGIIGIFVLLLACINFMNLATARAQRRAKEVGIRKTVGSDKYQLITQFMFESFLVTSIAFMVACALVVLFLPSFNDLAGKQMVFPHSNSLFWLIGLGLVLITSLLAGSYPSLYLSSFRPLKALKGTTQSGKSEAFFRKALVVVQFTVSIILMVGTVIINRQIQHTKDRPVGYDRDQLIMIPKNTGDYEGKYNLLRESLKNSGAVTEIAESSSPLTEVWNSNGGFEWEDKDPNLITNIVTFYVSHDYGRTVGWDMAEGRDFSRDFGTDSTAYILNRAAVEYMQMENPIGETIRWFDGTHKVIGVVENLLTESPFEPVKPSIYMIDYGNTNWIGLKLSPSKKVTESLTRIKQVFGKIAPNVPFEYEFVDEAFGKKFVAEERLRRLSEIFSVLAIVISCLGLFGLASFVAEKRTKEIGIRKVLGASISSLLKMLSKDFALLVLFSGLISTPIANYFMGQWLESYTYRIEIPWWVFGAAIFLVLFIALVTVSFQAVRAARQNPIRSLQVE